MPDIGQYIGRQLNTLEFIDTFLFLEVAYSTNIFSKILFTLSQTLPFSILFLFFLHCLNGLIEITIIESTEFIKH